MTYEVPDDAPRTTCDACRTPIAFVLNPATGRHVPVSLRTMENHFTDCTDPNRFRKSQRRKAATANAEFRVWP